MSLDWIISACLGIGLAACCGFRVFVPLLVASVFVKLGIIHVTPDFAWLSSWPALLGLTAATVFEIGSYYIPWLDNALDTIATPSAILAGTLLSTSFLQINNPVLHWGLGLIVGGGTASIVQAGTSLLRLGSTATTGGIANPMVSTGENIASLGLSLFTVFLPLVAIVIVVALILFVAWLLAKQRKVWFSRPKQSNTPGNPPLTQFPRSNNGRH